VTTGDLDIVKRGLTDGGRATVETGDGSVCGSLQKRFHLADYHGWSLIHVAILHSHYHVVEYLANNSNADVNHKNDNNDTPLHIAARRGDAHGCELLVSLGADPNLINSKGETAFDISGSRGTYNFLKKRTNYCHNTSLTRECIHKLVLYKSHIFSHSEELVFPTEVAQEILAFAQQIFELDVELLSALRCSNLHAISLDFYPSFDVSWISEISHHTSLVYLKISTKNVHIEFEHILELCNLTNLRELILNGFPAVSEEEMDTIPSYFDCCPNIKRGRKEIYNNLLSPIDASFYSANRYMAGFHGLRPTKQQLPIDRHHNYQADLNQSGSSIKGKEKTN